MKYLNCNPPPTPFKKRQNLHLCKFQYFFHFKTSMDTTKSQLIPHRVSNSVLSLQYILMDCFCSDTQTLDLPPGLKAIVGSTPLLSSPFTRQPDFTLPSPPSNVPRHHILVLLSVITTPITSQRAQTQPDAKHNTQLTASTVDSHDIV